MFVLSDCQRLTEANIDESGPAASLLKKRFNTIFKSYATETAKCTAVDERLYGPVVDGIPATLVLWMGQCVNRKGAGYITQESGGGRAYLSRVQVPYFWGGRNCLYV